MDNMPWWYQPIDFFHTPRLDEMREQLLIFYRVWRPMRQYDERLEAYKAEKKDKLEGLRACKQAEMDKGFPCLAELERIEREEDAWESDQYKPPYPPFPSRVTTAFAYYPRLVEEYVKEYNEQWRYAHGARLNVNEPLR